MHLHRPRFTRGASIEHPVHAPVIRTRRLVLRPYSLDDADRWFEIQSSSAVREFTSWPDRDRESSRLHLRDRTRHTTLRQADDFLALAVEFRGELVGDVSLHLRSVAPTSRFVEVSWMLHPAYRGGGLATEASRAILDLAFARVDARWAVAIVHPDNLSSLALADRLGFRQLETDPDSVLCVVTAPTVATAVPA